MDKRFASAIAITVALCFVGAATAGGKLFPIGNAVMTSKNSAHIVNDSGEYGGVYRNAISKKLLRKLIHLTFTVPNTSDVQGGAPRFSIPVNTDNDPNTTEGYAFLDAAGCGATVGVAASRSSDPSIVVATARSNCHVNFQGVDYANWNAFVGKSGGAHPTYTLAKQDTGENTMPFIIADVPGDYTITDIRLSS